MPSRTIAIMLALITLAAAVPRCWNIWRQGVEDYDGANFTLEAQLIVNVADGFWHKALGKPFALPKLDQLRGRPLHDAKPLFTVSLVPGWGLGFPRTDIASRFAAFWGVAIIPIIFLIGRELWSPREGLFAAAAYGASGFAAFYTRVSAAESFGFFVLAIALWQYVRMYQGARQKDEGGRMKDEEQMGGTGQRSRPVPAPSANATFKRRILFPLFVGFLWALAILANYRLLLTAAVVLTTCELLAIIHFGWRNLARSALTAAGLFGTLIATELAFRVAVHAWKGIGGEFHAMTYWEQLRYFLFEHRPVGERFHVNVWESLYDFAHYWWQAEAVALPLFGIAGMIAALRRPERFARADAALAVAAILMAAVWSVQHFTVPRVMAVLAIFLALHAGWAASALAKRWKLAGATGGVALAAAYCLLIATMVYRIGPTWFSRPSGYRELPAAVAKAGDAPLYAHWHQKPCTALYVTDRPILQIDDEPGAGDFSPTHMPDSGLLVADGDYVTQHYPDAEILGHWPMRLNSNALGLADITWSWDKALARSEQDIPLVLARLKGKARDVPAAKR